MFYLSNDPSTKDFRRQLRRESTPCERILWNRLRNKQVMGLRFRQQHGYGAYVLDFYCPTIRLCIEVDGEVHDTDDARIHDEERTKFLEEHGITVIRFRNEEIENGADGVVEEIKNYINNRDWGARYANTPNPLI